MGQSTFLTLVGASGMVGGHALRYALDDPDVSQVTSIGRRKLGISHSYRLLRAIYPAFRIVFPNQVVRSDDLARVMVNVAVRGAQRTVFENRDIRSSAHDRDRR